MPNLYQTLRRFLFLLPPEAAHTLTLSMLNATEPLARLLASSWLGPVDPRLSTEVAGLSLRGPVGLAAGLDKDGLLGRFWPSLGFGFVELGTVTAQAQSGNPKPRLFRFAKEEALINRMGFNNSGSFALAALLAGWKRRQTFPLVPVGVNLGKSKITPLSQAAEDYATSAHRVARVADYLTINVSSPNTPGLRQLQDAAALREIILAVKESAPGRPVFVKLSPDLSEEALLQAAQVSEEMGASGLIATNTTVERFGLPEVGAGGLSGKPLRPLALSVVRRLSPKTRLPIIAVGGISSVEDVLAAFSAGAVAVQLYTALIFEGPGLIQKINRGLLSLMERKGLSDLASLRAWAVSHVG